MMSEELTSDDPFADETVTPAEAPPPPTGPSVKERIAEREKNAFREAVLGELRACTHLSLSEFFRDADIDTGHAAWDLIMDTPLNEMVPPVEVEVEVSSAPASPKSKKTAKKTASKKSSKKTTSKKKPPKNAPKKAAKDAAGKSVEGEKNIEGDKRQATLFIKESEKGATFKTGELVDWAEIPQPRALAALKDLKKLVRSQGQRRGLVWIVK